MKKQSQHQDWVHQATVNNAPDEGELIDLLGLTAIARRNWRMALLIGSVLFFIVLGVGLATPTLYTATGRILLDLGSREVVGVGQVLPTRTLNDNVIETEIEVISSELLLKDVIYDLDLLNSAAFKADAAGQSPATALKQLARSALKSSDNNADRQDGAASGLLSERAAMRSLTSRLNVRRNGGSFIINISYTSRSKQLAQRITSSLIESYLAQQSVLRREATEQARTQLEEQLTRLRGEVEQADANVAAAGFNGDGSNASSRDVLQKQLQSFSGEYSNLQRQLTEKKATAAQLSDVVNDDQAANSITPVLAGPVIGNLLKQKNDLELRLKTISERYQPNHPTYIAARAAVREVEEVIAREIRLRMSQTQTDIEFIEKRIVEVENQMNVLDARLASDAAGMASIDSLRQIVESKRATYLRALQRYNEVSLQNGIDDAGARVLEMPGLPKTPSSLSGKRVLAAAVIVALLGALGTVVAVELLDTSVRIDRDIKRFSSAPVLANMPAFKHRNVFSDFEKMPKRGQQALKAILGYAVSDNKDNSARSIAILSSVPGEGKTRLTFGLAQLASISGMKVLCIDGDPHRMGLTRLINSLEPESNRVRPAKARAPQGHLTPERSHSQNFDFLPARALFDENSLAPEAVLTAFFEEIKNRYDLVIVDAAPVHAVSESIWISRFCDKILMSVKWGRTSKNVLQTALNLLNDAELSVDGFIMNHVDVARYEKFYLNFSDKTHRSIEKYYTP